MSLVSTLGQLNASVNLYTDTNWDTQGGELNLGYVKIMEIYLKNSLGNQGCSVKNPGVPVFF